MDVKPASPRGRGKVECDDKVLEWEGWRAGNGKGGAVRVFLSLMLQSVEHVEQVP